MKRSVPVRVAVLLLLAGIGCSARGPGPYATAPAVDDRCAAVHAGRVEQRQRFGGISGSGSLRLYSAAGRGRASFDFTYRRPDSLRLEFRTPFGPAAAVLDIEGERWLFADFRRGFFVRGEGGGAFRRFTGLPAGPATLIPVLLAEPMAADHGLADLRFHPGTCLPLGCRIVVPGGGDPPITVNYRWPDRPAGAADTLEFELPERVVLLGPAADRETVIRFKHVRMLSTAELEPAPAAVALDGLEEAPPVAERDGLPEWLR